METDDAGTDGQITVYAKPACVQCDATKRILSKYGLPFVEIDLSLNEDVVDQLKAAGWMRAPVVMTPQGEVWSGFRPDRIRDLASRKPSRATGTERSRSPASNQGGPLIL